MSSELTPGQRDLDAYITQDLATTHPHLPKELARMARTPLHQLGDWSEQASDWWRNRTFKEKVWLLAFTGLVTLGPPTTASVLVRLVNAAGSVPGSRRR